MMKTRLKSNLAFVDHPFHKKTKSGNFLREIFKKKFRIKNYWKSEFTIYELKRYKYIFFFQNFLSMSEILKLKNSLIVWAPMYDSLTNFDPNIWEICSKFNNIKILSFSNEITKLCKKHKLNYLNCKFYLPPQKKINRQKKLNIFFWYRGQINLYDWIKFFDLRDINKIFFYHLVDPYFKEFKIKKLDRHKFKINFIKGNFKKRESLYLKKIKDSDVFVAPRKKEGIGMSFLEALSFSKFIVGYKDSTMSEYINNHKIGFLFNEKTKKKILLEDIYNYRLYRHEHQKKEFKKWLVKRKEIENLYSTISKTKKIHKNLNFYILYSNNLFYEIQANLKKRLSILIK